MDGAHDIPDSTDWLNTPLRAFADLENALHCQICKEFYDTPMITSCAHTFCSKCIRTSLSADGKCPACRAPEQASKLRNNWVLQEVVATFFAARPVALEVARKEQEEAEKSRRPGKRKRVALESDDVEEGNGRTTRSKSRRLAASQDSQVEAVEIDDTDGDEDFEPQPDDGLVECPLGCGKRMKIEAVEPHLDRCEEERKQASRPKSRTPINGFTSSRPASRQNAKPQERLAELNYSLMKENAMRKKFDELGIPSWGPKPLLIRRHTEWVNLWNANCDSNHPRTKRELLQDLDTWERTQGGKAPQSQTHSNGIMKKEFDGMVWASKHNGDFSRLIADAKRKKMNPATAASPPKDEPQAVDFGMPAPNDDSEDTADPVPSNHKPSPVVNKSAAQPYAGNEEALSSIREKVEAANAGQQIEPVMNAGFQFNVDTADPGENLRSESAIDDGTSSAALPGTQNPALLSQSSFGKQRTASQDEHSRHERTGSPCDFPTHLRSSTPRKLPMFAVPQEPISDIDGADGPSVQ